MWNEIKKKQTYPIHQLSSDQEKCGGGGGMEEQETLNRCCLYKVDQRQNYKVEK